MRIKPMKEQNHYSSWRSQTRRLSEPEMEQPLQVVDQFFHQYQLSAVRNDLWQMVRSAQKADEANSVRYVTLWIRLEKFIEAAFVILHQEKALTALGTYYDISKEEGLLTDFSFLRRRPFLSRLHDNPKAALEQIFTTTSLKDLKDNLKIWGTVMVAHSDYAVDFKKHEFPEELHNFLNRMLGLAEALYLIYDTHEPNKSTISQSVLRFFGLAKNRNTLQYLSEIERKEPLLVIWRFFEAFSLPYCRRQLWKLLNAVSSYEGEPIKGFSPADVLRFYECYWCLLEIGWRLNPK